MKDAFMLKLFGGLRTTPAILCTIALIAALLGGGGRAAAQNKNLNLKITVLSNTDGQPVVGASCLLTDYGIFSITDPDGKADLNKVPKGKASLSVQMLGYEDYLETFQFTKDSTLVIHLDESSLALEQVVVTAKASAAGSSTSSNIGRMAIDHLQATNLADVMQLIPGQLMTETDMTSSSNRITLRSASDNTANNAFGTSILVDGVPVSDNTSLGSNAGTGVDARQISTDNIESVEVIRGIPSAEYGDLTSGAVVVNTKAGYTPYEIRAKLNPTTLNASFGKGWKFSKDAGSLNVNADYARASGDPRKKNQSFDRISGGITYSNTVGVWSSTTKVNVNSLVDLRTVDPDLVAEGTESGQNQYSIRLAHNGRLSLNKFYSRSLTYAAGLTLSNSHSWTSSIVPADGGKAIITSLTDGYYQVPYITTSYRASGRTLSQPVNFFAKVGNVFTVNTAKVKQRFNMGAEYRYEANKAAGFTNDDNFMPLKPSEDGRPRPYYDIPALNQISAYLEDNLTWEMPLGMEFKLQGGVRFDMMQPGLPEQVHAFSPRFNASLRITPWLTLRGGWGQSNKTPGLSHLYPDTKYSDRLAASYLPADASKQLVVYHTHITNVERNNSLKNATNTKAEVGFDLNFKNGMSASVVAYQDVMTSGFGNLTEYSVYYANYYTAETGIRTDADGNPYIEWNHPARVDTVFTTSGRIGNTEGSLNRGIEFDINLGQIKPIHTTVLLSGAYNETQIWSTGPNYQSPMGVTSPGGANTPPFKLLYPSGVTRDIDSRLSANLRLVCNIPRMKMVISLANQLVLFTYRHTTNQKSDPVAWIDTDLSVHPITQAMLDDPEYRIKGVLLANQRKNPTDTEPNWTNPIWLMNMRLTKDVSKNFGFSFYVNNAFFHMPYQASSKSSTLTERNTGTFSFGVEMFVKI